jgi:AcrR family transcriptional regulator
VATLAGYASEAMTEVTAKRRGRPPAGGREAILRSALELLRERGISRLTTREVAARAGVSEASVFYHYRDRAGLLRAVFEEGLGPLIALKDAGEISGTDRRKVLRRLGEGIVAFLEQAMPVLTAAQSDAELAAKLAEYMRANDLGPHRGVSLLGDYLAALQRDGLVRADIDPEAVASMFVSTCLMRAFQTSMRLPKRSLPSLTAVIDSLDRMLEPLPEV